MRDVDRSRAEQQRSAPLAQQRNVGCVRDGRDLEAGNDVKLLGGNIGAVFDLRLSFRPFVDDLLDRRHVADEAEHDFGLAERGDDVPGDSAVDRANVDRGVAEDRVLRKDLRFDRRQQLEHWFDRRLAEVRIRRVRRAAPSTDGYTQRTLGTARQPALGRLTVDEKGARCRKLVRRPCSVGALLFAHDKEEVHALLAGGRQIFGGAEHRGRYSLGVAGPPAKKPFMLELRRDVRRNGIEVGGEGDQTLSTGRPEVGAPTTDLLRPDVPPALNQPL